MLALVALTGAAMSAVALAQAVAPDTLPADWQDLAALLFGGGAGLAVLVPAMRRGLRHPDELLRSKTFWTGVSMALATVALYLAGQIGVPGLIGGIYLALVAVFLRDAVAAAGGGGHARSVGAFRIAVMGGVVW